MPRCSTGVLGQCMPTDITRRMPTAGKGKSLRTGYLRVRLRAISAGAVRIRTPTSAGRHHSLGDTLNSVSRASEWKAAQFLDGDRMSGNELGLRIAAGNVPNLVHGPFDGNKSIIGPWGIIVDGNDNIWVANNWQLPQQAGFQEVPPEAVSTRFGGNGAVIFFGIAKPVRTPLIGPVQGW